MGGRAALLIVAGLIVAGPAIGKTRWQPCHFVESNNSPPAERIHVRGMQCVTAQQPIFDYLEHRWAALPRHMRDDNGRRYRCRSRLRPPGAEDPILHVLCARGGRAFWFEVET